MFKSAINKLSLEINSPLIQFEYEAIDWFFKEEEGISAVLHSKLNEGIAFEYVCPYSKENKFLWLTREDVDNAVMYTLVTVSVTGFNKYDAVTFFYVVEDEEITKLAYQDPASKTIIQVPLEDDEDTTEEITEELEDEYEDYDEDDDEDEDDSGDEIIELDMVKAGLCYSSDDLINSIMMVDSLLDIIQCANVTIDKYDSESLSNIINIHKPTSVSPCNLEKSKLSKRYADDKGFFNTEAFNKGWTYNS